MKKICKIIMVIIVMISITGCGKIKSEKQVLKNAKKEYGTAEVVSKEVISKDNVIYILKDKKDNFMYQCKSYMQDIGMDGSTFFTHPTITCDFNSNYQNYITNQMKNTKLIMNHNLTILKSDTDYYDGNGSFHSFEIHGKSVNEEHYKSILKELQKIDDRNYFKKIALQIYDDTNKKIGVITSNNYQFLTVLEEHDKWFIEYANRTFSKSGRKDSEEIEFVRKEENVLIKDREELYEILFKNASLDDRENLETATTTIYYFYDNVAKIDFYIIDYYIFGQACYYNNYSAEIRNDYTNSLRCKEWWN